MDDTELYEIDGTKTEAELVADMPSGEATDTEDIPDQTPVAEVG